MLRTCLRVRIGVRCVAVLSAMLMVLGSASNGLAAPVPRGQPGSFLFPLRLTGLTASVVDGQVVLVDSAGRQRAVFPAGSMTDSATAGTAGADAEIQPIRQTGGLFS